MLAAFMHRPPARTGKPQKSLLEHHGISARGTSRGVSGQYVPGSRRKNESTLDRQEFRPFQLWWFDRIACGSAGNR